MTTERQRTPVGPTPGESEGEGSAPAESGTDVALIHGVSQDGRQLAIVRRRQERLEFATAVPLEQGKPIHGEVVRLKPRPEFPLVCDVEVQVPAPAAAHSPERPSPRKGPAQIASEEYRRNWDVIWRKPRAGDAPN